jgi:sigma-B regulation protein RsbU (phosphoserine phosphatase)
MPDCKVEVASTVLDPGDLLFAYTDGVLDATDTGSSFGESRLIALLTQAHASADALLGTLGLALETYSAGADPFDDVTMLAVRRTG